MRIAQVAPPLESVPPKAYGGTERVVSTLTEELVKRGHQVTLFASGDSQTSAHLVPIVDRALWHHEPPYRDLAPFWTITLGEMWKHMGEFDLVHSHLDYAGFPAARAAPCPMLTTLHGRLDLRELRPLYRAFRDVPLVSISNSQRQPVPNANWQATVYHGIELDEYSFNAQPDRYLAFLGRIAPDKGLDIAIRVARRAGLQLRIAARMPLPFMNDPSVRQDWDYYETAVLPLLHGTKVDLIGQVSGEEKNEFLRNAVALLFPITWPEPFGLVMVEALACGTPVVALNRGSVPEVLSDGVTGLICDDEDEMVDALARLDTIDRARCRAEAEARFSPEAMAVAYEQVYARLTSTRAPEPVGTAST